MPDIPEGRNSHPPWNYGMITEQASRRNLFRSLNVYSRFAARGGSLAVARSCIGWNHSIVRTGWSANSQSNTHKYIQTRDGPLLLAFRMQNFLAGSRARSTMASVSRRRRAPSRSDPLEAD